MVSIRYQHEREGIETLQNGLDAVFCRRTGLQQHAAGLVRSNSSEFFQIVLVIGKKQWRESSSMRIVSVAFSSSGKDKICNAEDHKCVCSYSVFKRE